MIDRIRSHGLLKHMNGYTLGISSGYHDSAVCIVDPEGEVAFAAQEERFTRLKNDKSFPYESLRAGFKYLDIDISAIQKVGYYEIPEENMLEYAGFSRKLP